MTVVDLLFGLGLFLVMLGLLGFVVIWVDVRHWRRRDKD